MKDRSLVLLSVEAEVQKVLGDSASVWMARPSRLLDTQGVKAHHDDLTPSAKTASTSLRAMIARRIGRAMVLMSGGLGWICALEPFIDRSPAWIRVDHQRISATRLFV